MIFAAHCANVVLPSLHVPNVMRARKSFPVLFDARWTKPVRRAVANGASTAQQRRVPLAVAAVTLIAGYLAFRWWRKR